MNTLTETTYYEKRLHDMKNLAFGWLDGTSEPPSKEVIEKVRQLLKETDPSMKVSIYPLPDEGGILLESTETAWYWSLDIFNANKDVSYHAINVETKEEIETNISANLSTQKFIEIVLNLIKRTIMNTKEETIVKTNVSVSSEKARYLDKEIYDNFRMSWKDFIAAKKHKKYKVAISDGAYYWRSDMTLLHHIVFNLLCGKDLAKSMNVHDDRNLIFIHQFKKFFFLMNYQDDALNKERLGRFMAPFGEKVSVDIVKTVLVNLTKTGLPLVKELA